MGPPPFGDGNAAGGTPAPLRKESFNGATAFRRWKLGHRDRHGHGPLRRAFNGATAFRRWKHVIEGAGGQPGYVPSMGPPPFGDGNHELHCLQQEVAVPSMGPPPFGDGNAPSGPPWPPRIPAFNGATAFRRWKPYDSGGNHVSGADFLQWGHRLSAMETCGRCKGCRTGEPFNGATAFRRWKLPQGPGCHTPGNRLQWGHRLSAMETSR